MGHLLIPHLWPHIFDAFRRKFPLMVLRKFISDLLLTYKKNGKGRVLNNRRGIVGKVAKLSTFKIAVFLIKRKIVSVDLTTDDTETWRIEFGT